MKKKYIQYRAVLFIGLSSLSTLSSCVNGACRIGPDTAPAPQVEYHDHSTSSQEVSRLGLIRANVVSVIRPLMEVSPERALFICGISYLACYYLGNYLGYAEGYAQGLLQAHLLSELPD